MFWVRVIGYQGGGAKCAHVRRGHMGPGQGQRVLGGGVWGPRVIGSQGGGSLGYVYVRS